MSRNAGNGRFFSDANVFVCLLICLDIVDDVVEYVGILALGAFALVFLGTGLALGAARVFVRTGVYDLSPKNAAKSWSKRGLLFQF